ncbi:tumor necrosis factor receptor superfamily member 14-like isoform X2 [Neoarius graeffei]|uniref:tumor necrosis factor receptor superfamily member 14-like isoform X2 n=1 Tax=Neoarius graeffei TaxID=443677 RepID=UPI00298C29FD|nr:tumor necrosis factor receptor superfamily member 14-like isoform X2 [Neoarius graeffei]
MKVFDGNRVYRHCTEFTSTTCMPCVGSTYTAEPNGLPSCITCTVCDPGPGLRVKTACTRTSDTVCEPLEGFYCTDEYRDSCRYAVEHTKCSPGQYIKQKGTAVKDAECAVCADGTYSNGSLQICKPHTKCEDLGLKEITPGTNYFDVECGRKTPVHLIAGIIVAVAVVVVAGVIVFLIKHKKVPPTAGTAEKPRFSTNQTRERETSLPLTSEERHFGVCMVHFDSSCFTRPHHIKASRRILVSGAVPVIWKTEVSVVSTRERWKVRYQKSHVLLSSILSKLSEMIIFILDFKTFVFTLKMVREVFTITTENHQASPLVLMQ